MKKRVTWQEARDTLKTRRAIQTAILDENIERTATPALYHHLEYIDMCRTTCQICVSVSISNYKKSRRVLAWRDSKNKMLQRIYGYSRADKNTLAEYLTRLEEAAKRDHRKLVKH